MITLYLDMDGVLCNFERRYFELYNELPGSMRDRKDFNVHWDHFIETKQFELKRDALPAGVYFYKLTTSGKKVANGKLVVE